jgi:cysteine-rich repeat protein
VTCSYNATSLIGNCLTCIASYTVSANFTVCTATGAVCGNGIKEGAETCDDGNVVALDGCDNLCALETASPVWNCTTTNPTVCTRC